jgi:hypothetical protein
MRQGLKAAEEKSKQVIEVTTLVSINPETKS